MTKNLNRGGVDFRSILKAFQEGKVRREKKEGEWKKRGKREEKSRTGGKIEERTREDENYKKNET